MVITASDSARRIQVVAGDITQQRVDAIVNAANSQLVPGGGVCGVIHRAAGPELAQACREIGPCPTGEAVTTPGFNLPARWVIHAVGPVWSGGSGGEAELLASCYRAVLREADRVGAKSIAIPTISAGIYGFPLDDACAIAVRATTDALADSDVDEVRLVGFTDAARDAYRRALADQGSR